MWDSLKSVVSTEREEESKNLKNCLPRSKVEELSTEMLPLVLPKYLCPSLWRITTNGLQLPVVRFETVVYRNATNKDTMFMDFCKAKIIVVRGATLFAKALLSARITGRCC